MERTNIADLDDDLGPDGLDLLTIDLSYLPLAEAIRQLGRLNLRPAARLVALVKPTFELARGQLTNDSEEVQAAIVHATAAIQRNGWTVLGITLPTVTGANGDRHHSHPPQVGPPLGGPMSDLIS